MKHVVVDASVAAKWFIPEIHSEAAARLLDAPLTLYAPDLIFAEVGNLLWKKIRRRELSRDDATEIVNAFAAMPIEIVPSVAIISGAFDLATHFDRTVYDSLYLALAVANDGVLVTADAKFHDAIAASALAEHIHWVGDEI